MKQHARKLRCNSAWSLASICCFVAVFLLASCGFQLRQPVALPFSSVSLTGKTLINTPLIKLLTAQGVQLTDNAEQADLRLELIREENEKRILSLSGTGVVREFELYYRVVYRTKLAGEAWSLPLIMESRRDYTYNDAALLAKQAEERKLIEVMQSDVINGILRRVSALKKSP